MGGTRRALRHVGRVVQPATTWPLALPSDARLSNTRPIRVTERWGDTNVKRVAMAAVLALSVMTGSIAQAHDRSGAESAVHHRAIDRGKTPSRLDALSARLLDDGTTLAERLSAAKARQENLAALIEDDPGEVLRLAISAKARAKLPEDVHPYLEEHATLEGDVEVVHEDSDAGCRTYYVLNRGGDRVNMHFAADAPSLLTGDRVEVTGVRVKHAMALESGNSSVTALALASPNTIGPQHTAVIMVAFQDRPAPADFTAQNARNTILNDNGTSASSYFREASYGQTWLTGDVYGPYVIPMDTRCSTGSIASLGDQAAAAQVGAAKMATYKRIVYLFPGAGCSWWGMATAGGVPSRLWVNGSYNAGLIAHEMGHNFGLSHSNAMLCDGVSVGQNCVTMEYGDPFDVMGHSPSRMHYNAVQKERIGWLNYGGSPPITTVEASGVYTIDPYETRGSNPKALKVRTKSGDWYYVEYRQAIGFDAARLAGTPNVTNGVLVHLWRGESAGAIYLLDMTPLTPDMGRPALGVGDVFSDPASGITIATMWADEAAGVKITMGGTCVRAAPTVTVSPGQQQGGSGTKLNYMLSVKNNDTGCPAPSYVVQAVAPAGWTTSTAPLAASTATSSASTTPVSITMGVTSAAIATAGTYTVSANVFDAAAPAFTTVTRVTYQVTNPSTGGGGTGGGFNDEFNRPDSTTLGSGWTQVAGAHGIQTGAAIGAAALNLAVVPSVSGATASAQATFIRPTSASGTKFGVVVRYRDASNYYVCYRQAGGSSQWKISKVLNGKETALKAVSVPQAPIGTPFKVSCTITGTTISIGDGSATKASVTDASLATGSIGVWTDKGGKIDSFSGSGK
jgi:hypothetical protein